MQLARGKNLIFTPGVYDIDETIKVKRAGHGRARTGYRRRWP